MICRGRGLDKFSARGMKRVFLCFVTSLLLTSALFLYIFSLPEFTLRDVRSYDFSKIVFDREGNVINVSLSKSDEWCIPVSLDQMGRWLPTAVVAIEDKRFYKHHGIDIMAIFRAAYSNMISWKVVSGASTITSQVIRISDPRDRTVRAKISEFWRAARIERTMTKDEILELYLNRAPFGGNIRGVEAAARAYFNKSASTLSLGESVVLISLLRSPSRTRPDRFPERAREVRNKTLDRGALQKVISQENIKLAKMEPVIGKRYPMPNEASMAIMHSTRRSYNQQMIMSTLDMKFQMMLEKTIKDALAEYPEKITAAGIIVENITGEVLAYVGNARHGDALPGAQVDCGDAPRSPGSTLKPFIYAEAFERGMLTPASLLADTPLFFRGSAPRNFDMSYRGPVSARVSLSSSLNAPAVRVLRMVGYPSALSRLRTFGFRHLTRDSAHYTDSLILGGCEVTLIELAAAYRALANEGHFTPLRWTKNEHSVSPYKAISPEAAYITTNILQDTSRLIPLYKELFEERKQLIAFKTGTSHGFRDAWCAGYSRNYTVVIWLGSPLGIGDSMLLGMQSATPIMLKVMREIWPESETPATRPDGIYSRAVCAVSGALPTKNCPQKIFDLAIKDVSSLSLCGLHTNINGVITLTWPQSIRGWMRQVENADTNIQKNRPEDNDKVKIIRPLAGHSIIIRDGQESERIFLSAEGKPPYFWYLDGTFVGTDIKGDGIFTEAHRGRHKASVLSNGNTESVVFDVLTPRDIRTSGNDARNNVIN
ncbi:MAG: penicillin-binding protein 1C [Synergistaceae bacterium]|jgi:penicillin-binding protein 1C|nr:penicillin-binding protein 1C [Synergistaceae bacterium]